MTPAVAPVNTDTYEARSARCEAEGHQPVVWALSEGCKRVLCVRCGRTWPMEWLRLVTMRGVRP